MLIPNADFSQLARIDQLLEHYAIHQTEATDQGQEISFVSFLYLHYVLKDDHQHSDASSHQQLPLGSLTAPAIFYLNNPTAILPNKATFVAKQFISFRSQLISPGFVTSVFHPPAILIA